MKPTRPEGADLRQIVRYLAVGAWNTLFGYSLFAAFTYGLTGRVARPYMYAYALSSVLAIAVAFVLYKTFVFRTRGNALQEFLRVNAVYGGTTLLGFVLLPILVRAMSSLMEPAWAPYVAQAIVVPITIAASFVGHKRFSFRTREGGIP